MRFIAKIALLDCLRIRKGAIPSRSILLIPAIIVPTTHTHPRQSHSLRLHIRKPEHLRTTLTFHIRTLILRQIQELP
ncbi:hypothetical protein K469DRAFT_706662 [Zopfia rhizophila CBS 207.26]|uniref:Uncharacterized protein n=1 Tax=Zopfia rhizophila CBS 207.26 TaxID=1314779 RepID=A0A6A6E7X5_9PEZI|nr:hypothetical protein K469DRAFT_706662 [Zopfia rhizophila CBS 207.26]